MARRRGSNANSLRCHFGQAKRHLSRDLKYIAQALLKFSFLSSSPTCPAMQSYGLPTARTLRYLGRSSTGWIAPASPDARSGRDARLIARPPPRSVRAAFPHTCNARLFVLLLHSFVRPLLLFDPRREHSSSRPDRILPSPSRAARVKDGACSA
jgi:hypothetical protein